MSFYQSTRVGLKASGVLLSIAAAVAFYVSCYGPRHNDWGVVASFVCIFLGIVLFAFGWLAGPTGRSIEGNVMKTAAMR